MSKVIQLYTHTHTHTYTHTRTHTHIALGKDWGTKQFQAFKEVFVEALADH